MTAVRTVLMLFAECHCLAGYQLYCTVLYCTVLAIVDNVG